jgi:predicted nucleotidyltransferase
MDMGDPTRSITPTLDGPVLAVLARSGRPLTVGEVAAETVRGSEIGVRRCLARLVDQGLVQATEMGRNRVHELNREHIAAPIATTMADLRIELWRRMRKELNGWKPKPLYACAFGSAARGDGDVDSDVDVLLVHPPFPGEAKPARKTHGIDAVAALMTAPMVASPAEAARWSQHIDKLRAHVLLWSGNPLQVVDLSFAEWVDRSRNTALIADIERDAIDLMGNSIATDSARANRTV